jgi:hypothetical protein
LICLAGLEFLLASIMETHLEPRSSHQTC